MRQRTAVTTTSILILAGLAWTLRPWDATRSAQARSGPPVLWEAPAFSFIDQDEQRVSNTQLLGQVWVCDFFLINCAGSCPRMTDALLALQRKLDPRVRLVSFTVDPLRDTPDALKAYAREVGADETRWRFLTTEESQLRQTATAMGLISPAEAADPDVMVHSDKFFLVDQRGRVRGVYESADPAQCERLVADAQRLLGESSDVGEPLRAAPSAVYELVPGNTTAAPAAEALARDLVCGMDVQACAKTPSTAFEGRSYYFCHVNCLRRFEANPQRYLGGR